MEARALKDCVLDGRYIRSGQRVTVNMEKDKLPPCLEPVKKPAAKRKDNADPPAPEAEKAEAAERPRI